MSMVDFARARRTMVDNQLRTSGITDWRILEAMNQIPRERFVPENYIDFAYSDETIPLSSKRSLASPAAFAKLMQLAEVNSQDVVLDVGCGTGYSTAVLARLANAVVALESEEALAARGNDVLADLDVGNAAIVAGPLEQGLPKEAPFDVIMLEGAVDVIPHTLFDQLRDGGRLVAVIGTGNAAIAQLYVKSGRDVAAISTFNASLPLLGHFAQKSEFVF